MARVLIGCETSGIVREAFLEYGHDAWSCDILPSDVPTNRHFQADVRDVMRDYEWDMLGSLPIRLARGCATAGFDGFTNHHLGVTSTKCGKS